MKIEPIQDLCEPIISRNIEQETEKTYNKYGIGENREMKRDLNLKMGIQILRITAPFYTAQEQTTLVSSPKSNPKPSGAEKERSDKEFEENNDNGVR